MHVGHYISGMVHAGLIGWMLIGPVFVDEPEELLFADVSIISPEAFAELTGEAEQIPVALPVPDPVEPQPEVEDRPPSLAPPPLEAQTLELDTPETPVERQDTPPPPDPVQQDPEPLPPAPEPPVPTPEVASQAPEAVAPVPDLGPGTPDVSVEATPRFAPRVAPEAAPPPPPDSAVALLDQPALSPDAIAPVPREEEPPAQREEATSRIVPEVQRNASGAPGTSLRPRARPAVRTTSIAEPEPEGETSTAAAAPPAEPDPAGDAISAALFEALASNSPDLPTGPPLSASETTALRLAMQACWVVDVGSLASNVTVTVAMSMNENGTVRESTLRLLASSGGAGAAVEVAFQAARRAILRCQQGGYALPAEKYSHWRDIEVTFNPRDMRLR